MGGESGWSGWVEENVHPQDTCWLRLTPAPAGKRLHRQTGWGRRVPARLNRKRGSEQEYSSLSLKHRIVQLSHDHFVLRLPYDAAQRPQQRRHTGEPVAHRAEGVVQGRKVRPQPARSPAQGARPPPRVGVLGEAPCEEPFLLLGPPLETAAGDHRARRRGGKAGCSILGLRLKGPR